MHLSRRAALILVVTAAATFTLPGTARGDAVTQWNLYANASIFATTPASHLAQVKTAIVQAAVYDAVNSIAGGYRPYLATTPAADPMYSQDAAAATAAFLVASALTPSWLATLQGEYDTYLATIDPGAAKDGGIAVGEAAANAILAARANDGRGGAFTFVFGTTPGVWRKSPPLYLADPAPWVGNVTPFMLRSPSQLRTEGPNKLTSEQYAKDFNEVKAIGSLTSTTRTPDQTMAAIFWQSPPGGLYAQVMRAISAQKGLSTADNARLFARVSLAAADGAIACWNDKYYWNFWRPTDAIRDTTSDGNPATVPDPNWLPLFDPSTATTPALSTPAFPDHPSGHTCVSGAAFGVMKDFFHANNIAFDITSTRFPQQPRHFTSFSQALKEVIDARVWGGIHFRTADVQGAQLGNEVAAWEKQHFFQPVNDGGDDGADH
jgi:hypothetical protein